MLAHRLIERKLGGEQLAPEEWSDLVSSFVGGNLDEMEMGVLLRGVTERGMSPEEILALAHVLWHLTPSLDVARLAGPRLGIGFLGCGSAKVSLLLAPLLASLDAFVPIVTGSGSGGDFGVIAALESIPGMRTRLGPFEAREILERTGCVITRGFEAASPGGKRLNEILRRPEWGRRAPILAALALHGILAERVTGAVFAIGHGPGTDFPVRDHCVELGRLMADLGRRVAVPVAVLVTAADRPVGRAFGNALEMEEVIHALHGEGPGDLMSLAYALGAEAMVLSGMASGVDSARRAMEVSISSGRAARRMRDMIAAQSGDPRTVDEPGLLPQAAVCALHRSPRTGVVTAVIPRGLESGTVALGGGWVDDVAREPSAGFIVVPRTGDVVKEGDPVATILARDTAGVELGRGVLLEAIQVGEEADFPLPLISCRVTADGAEAWDAVANPDGMVSSA